MKSNSYLITALAILLIGGVAAAGYFNSFTGPFLFDDFHNITGNEYMQIPDLSFESLKKAAVKGPLPHRWFPKASFAVNYYFAEKKPVGHHANISVGGQSLVEPDVWGYHLVNLLIHIGAGICLYFLFMAILSSPLLGSSYHRIKETALAASLLWVVHPVQTNAVTYIVQRMTSMAALFTIASLLFYILARRPGYPGLKKAFLFLLSLGTGLLALFSKENGAILPIMIGGCELYFIGGLRFSLKRKADIIMIAALLLLVAGLGWYYMGGNPLGRVLHAYDGRDFTLEQRLLTQPRVIFHYLSLLILPLPSRLNLAYDYQTSLSLFSPPQTILALGGIFFMLFLVFFLYRRDRLMSFAIFWFLGNLLIESSIIPLEMIFEHRVYLPSAFLMLAVVSYCYRWGGHHINRIRLPVVAAVLLLVFFTWQRNQTWSSRENVWADVAAKSPALTRGHMGLYVTYKAQNRRNEAMASLHEAIKVGPDEFRPSYNLAHLYWEEKRFQEALQVLNNMLNKPELRTAATYYLRAAVHVDLKKYQRAVNDALKALQVDPEHRDSMMILGVSYFRLGNYQQAVNYFTAARQKGENSFAVYFNLGTSYFNLRQYDLSLENYKLSLPKAPNRRKVHGSMSMVYGAKGMVKEMLEHKALSQGSKR